VTKISGTVYEWVKVRCLLTGRGMKQSIDHDMHCLRSFSASVVAGMLAACDGGEDASDHPEPPGIDATIIDDKEDPPPVDLPDLVGLIEGVTSTTGHRYGTRDSDGKTMDGLKVIADPEGGYLGVYHALAGNDFTSKLATSSDLMNWTFRRNIEPHSSQPTIAALPTGGFVVAIESDQHDGAGAHVLFRHYSSHADLLASRHDRQFDAPRSFSRCAEGTPDLHSVKLEPDIDHSTIEIGFHYYSDCDVDRQARGTLVNFSSWSATQAPAVDEAIIDAASAAGIELRGNIGDRDSINYGGQRFDIMEGGGSNSDFGSWRVYLYDAVAGSAVKLNPTTHRGSTAFANPTITSLMSPAGKPAIVVTLFVPSQGGAQGERGSLIYYTELP
jgi:hypothetical protein